MIYILQVGQNELAVRVLTNAGAPPVLEPTRGGHLIPGMYVRTYVRTYTPPLLNFTIHRKINPFFCKLSLKSRPE